MALVGQLEETGEKRKGATPTDPWVSGGKTWGKAFLLREPARKTHISSFTKAEGWKKS